MSFLQNFFYGVENKDPLVIPLALKLAILLVWFGVMALIVVFRKKLSASKHAFRIAKIAAVILLVDQVMLWSWQFLSGYFNFELSLPLYHCRIAVPLLILDLVFGVKVLRSIWIYWGFLGSIFAMGIMDPYRFDFPHFTNFQFFVVHMLLGWIVIYTIFALGYRFDKKGLKQTLIVTLLYNIGLIFFNAAFNGTFIARGDLLYNYGYMLYPPEPLKDLSLSLFPPFVFYFIMIIGYELLILLLYAIGRALNKISDRNGQTLSVESLKE
ncbi:MAG TPA: TIGR02206 family membrane protein [Clostridia bacterium]|nr:TIGR02206 family membrane protein [Clostridia bacterium]